MPHRLFDLFSRRSNVGQIPNLAIWLRAESAGDFTFSTGADVSAWVNRGNAGNAVQASAPLQPLRVASAINGRPAVQFYDDSTAKLLSIPDGAALDYTRYTLFTVFQRVTDLAAVERIAGKFSTTTPANAREHSMLLLTTDEVQGNQSIDGNPGVGFASASTTAIGTPYIATIGYDGTNGTTWLNNTAGTSAAVGNPFQGTSPFHIGAIDGGGQPFAGYIGEVLFYTRALTAAERKQVHAYLSAKWRIAIAP